MITDPNVVGYVGNCTAPSAHAIVWTVTLRDKAKTVLGTVTERTWMAGRDAATARWGKERWEIDVEAAKESA